MPKYQIRHYDVWGNEDDGWEVNNVFAQDEYYTWPLDAQEETILSDLGITEKDNIVIDPNSDETYIWFNCKLTGKPLFDALNVEI